jgi:hypothetical protein
MAYSKSLLVVVSTSGKRNKCDGSYMAVNEGELDAILCQGLFFAFLLFSELLIFSFDECLVILACRLYDGSDTLPSGLFVGAR